jgi:iron(III) transport system ATP-binding protein
VTHDQEEAMSLADTIFLFQNGRVVQRASPDEIYRFPKNRYVAEFLGKANIFPIVVSASAGGVIYKTADGGYTIATTTTAQRPGEFTCLVRPECWKIVADGETGIPGDVESLMYLGDRTELSVRTPIGAQLVVVPGFHQDIKPGSRIRLETDASMLHIFAEA